MKLLSPAFLTLLLGLNTGAQAQTLQVTVDNIQTQQGALMLVLFKGQADFDASRAPVVSLIHQVTGEQVQFALGSLPAGRYGIKVYQDINGNGVHDRNPVGIPTEPYGFSNNGGRFGPASFAEAGFDPAETAALTIHLR